MHKKILFAVGLALVAASCLLPTMLTFVTCGLLAAWMGLAYCGAGVLFTRRPPRIEYMVGIRAYAYVMVLATLISYGMALPLALKTFEGPMLFLAFGLMAGTTGFVFGWLAGVLKHCIADTLLQEASDCE